MKLLDKLKKSEFAENLKRTIKNHESNYKPVRVVMGTIYTIFPEFNMFVNKSVHSDFGLRFWVANSYANTSMPKDKRGTFLQKNIKNPFFQSTENKEDYAFNKENISYARCLNLVEPLYVGLQYVKSRIAEGIDKLLTKESGGTRSSDTAAVIAKGAIQILFLPIEIPVILLKRVSNFVLDGISSKIKSLFSSKKETSEKDSNEPQQNTIEMTEKVKSDNKEVLDMPLPASTIAENGPQITISSSVESTSAEKEKATDTNYIVTRLQEGLREEKEPAQKQEIEMQVMDKSTIDSTEQTPKVSMPESKLPSLKDLPVFARLMGKATPSFMQNIVVHNDEYTAQKKTLGNR